jgi:hypothetical protein
MMKKQGTCENGGRLVGKLAVNGGEKNKSADEKQTCDKLKRGLICG